MRGHLQTSVGPTTFGVQTPWSYSGKIVAPQSRKARVRLSLLGCLYRVRSVANKTRPSNPDTNNPVPGSTLPGSGMATAGPGDGLGSSGGFGTAPSASMPTPGYRSPAPASPGAYGRPQRGAVTDRPVCLSATWAMQGSEKKLVCLSWYYSGRIYTPDELEQVLALR